MLTVKQNINVNMADDMILIIRISLQNKMFAKSSIYISQVQLFSGCDFLVKH